MLKYHNEMSMYLCTYRGDVDRKDTLQHVTHVFIWAQREDFHY